MDYKKLSLVNDDVMKLWEETEAENRRLLSEMSRVRSELQETRYQMDAVSWKLSSKSYEKRPSSSTFNSKSSPSHQSLSLTYPSISPARNTSRSTKADALVLLKKQELNEIINSSKSSPNHLEKTSWRPSSRLSYSEEKSRNQKEEMDYKKLSLVNDDVMKLWEETEAEN